MLPRTAAVARFVDTVAIDTDRQEALGLGAATDVNRIRILRVQGDRADRERILLVENRRPVDASVDGLPYTAVGGSQINYIGVSWIHRQRIDFSRTPDREVDVVIDRSSEGKLRRHGTDRCPMRLVAVILAGRNRVQLPECPGVAPRGNESQRVGALIVKPLLRSLPRSETRRL